MSLHRNRINGALALLTALANPGSAQDTPTPELLAHRPLRVALHRLATDHPERIQLLSVGASRAGRPIDALRFAPATQVTGRPAILVVANLEGPFAYTSTLVLGLAERLATGADAGPLAALLANTTIYLIPRANPDGGEARFLSPLVEVRATGAGIDNDRDGRTGEDGPSDLNGDGVISRMRVLDPEGIWMADPSDERALVIADPEKGERGRWKVMVEGRDSDGDGEVGEDPMWDAHVDRNFPQEWEEHTAAGGLFPTDEPEARSLAEFVLHHRDIALVLVVGEGDNLADEPLTVADDAPVTDRVPKPGTLKSDAVLLKELADRLKTQGLVAASGKRERTGSFQAWCETQRGLPTISLRPWSLPLDDSADEGKPAEENSPAEEEGTDATPDDPEGEEPKPDPSDEAKALAWMERVGEEDRFLPWTTFDHPELGPVEIGGMAPYAWIEPPPDEWAALAEQLITALPVLAEALPRIQITSCTAKALGGGLFELEVALENAALLPLLSASARRARTPHPLILRLQLPKDTSLLAGDLIQSVDNLDGSGGREEVRWLVRSTDPTAITITADTDHVGSVQAQPELLR
jgi:hypothetical protein